MSPRFKPPDGGSHPPPKGLNRQSLRQLMAWVRPYRRTILVNCLLALFLAGVELVIPKMLMWTIDEAVAGAKAATDVAKTVVWNRLLLILAGLVAIFLMAMVVRHFEIRRIFTVGQQIMYGVRRQFFAHLHRLGLRYYDKMKAGQIIARGTSDIEALEQIVSWAPSQFVSSAILPVGAVTAMVLQDPILFFCIFPILPLLVWLTGRFRRRATGVWHDVQAQTGRLTANLAESIAGARVIQAFARERKNVEIFCDLTDELYESRVETARVHGRYMIGLRGLTAAATVLVILIGGYRVAMSNVSAGAIVAFLGYTVLFFSSIEQISELYNQLIYALAGAERINDVLRTQPEIVDRPGAFDPKHLEGDVVFDHVTFEYRPGVPVLHDLSFHVRPGETVALVGPTGAGKTTICRLIARFYETAMGEVRIDSRDVRSITQSGLHRHTGIVLQENFLFSGTVMDNIRYGRPDASDAEVIECARRIGSHKAVEALPQGYQTPVGERGETLSAGQRQLVCLTRAMLADPRLLILDEATSSVDTRTELAIQEAFRQLTRRRTSFVVAHRLSTVRQADRVLVIEGGRLMEEGTHGELLARGGRYATMYLEFIRSE